MLLAKTPEKYVEFMHALEDSLRSRILENYGIIDKFTGDGLVAHFPLFYSGEDAAVLCLKTAAECHREFEKIYAQKADCFIVTLADAALGIGVDFGKVHFAIRGQELIAVGTPVVYASRLSSVEGGRTVLNQQAWHIVHERYPTLVISQEKLKIPLKYQGECIAIAVQLQPGELCVKDPPWLR
jgi:class 3 adenylate cyclase